MYRYRERERDCSSDSDDDEVTNVTKLHKVKQDGSASSAAMDMDRRSDAPTVNKGTKRKINNIWSSVAQEQSINDDLCKVSMNRISDRLGWDRGSESYDFTRKADDPRPDTDVDEEIDLDYGVSDIENEFEASETGVVNGDGATKKKSGSKIPLVERKEDAQKMAREVARRLHEPKVELIERCVQVLGRKKVFDLLHMTEDIEESGGMLVVNGTRRRTAGGVFFYQLRKDSRIQKKEKNYIFAEDKEKDVQLKKSQRKLARKNARRANAKPKKMELEECGTTELTSEETTEPVLTSGNNVESTEQKESNDVPSDIELEDGEIL